MAVECQILRDAQALAEQRGLDVAQIHCPPHLRAACQRVDCLLAAVLTPSGDPRNADIFSPQLGKDAFMLRLERTAQMNGWHLD